LDTDNYQFSRGITDNCFAVGRLVKQYDGAELGSIIIFIKSQIFDDVLNITPSDENSSLYIVSQDGAMIYSHQNSAKALSVLNENYANLPAGRNSEVISEKGSSYLITYYTSAYSGWTMVNITPISYLLNGFVVNRNLTFLFCLLFILIAVIVAIYISGSITEPVKQIMLAMRGVSSGNMSLRIRTSGGREIKELGDHFNSMIEKIGLLMEENNAKQRGIAKAEISMLQAQINPHFLYNTLNSIRWLCIFNKQDQIKNMIDNLSRLIMHTYKESDALIPLSDEVIILNCYVNLMKVRYTNFDFNIVGIEDFLQFKVLKFTIQPFIENAIIHGFNGIDYEGRIEIQFKEQDRRLIVTVLDNGTGIPDEKKRIIQQLDGDKSSKFSSIGVENVIRRIQMNYGSDYGVTISDNNPTGTRIEIILPLIV
jgi:two-component system sensor histidine kinase YesM